MSQGNTSYSYNGNGVLVAQTQDSTITRSTQALVASLSQILQLTQGTQRTDYVYGHERLLALEGTAQTWYGSVRQTLDATGTVSAVFSYDPWGTPQGGATPPTFSFTGERQDATRGLVSLRARWYQPQHGRFTARDPFAGVDRMPVSLHPYQYGYTSPIRYTDSSGKHPGVCLLPAVADGPIPAGDVVTVGCAIVYAVGALVSTIAGQAAGEATGQIIRDQGLRGYYHTGTPAPVWSPRQVPPTTIMPPAPVGSGVRPFPGYADPQDGCAVPGFTPLPDVLRQRGRPGPTLLPGQGPVVLPASMSEELDRNMRAAGMTRPPNTAAHHIVAWNDPRAAAARAILAAEGIPINDAVNGVYLPKDTAHTSPPAHKHSSLHTDNYYVEVEQRLRQAAPGTVRAVLRQIARELADGTFPK